MSFTKKVRNIQSAHGKVFPDPITVEVPDRGYAEIVSIALKQQFAGTPCAMKLIARITGANERSVKNWWTGKNGPSGEHLAILTRHSDNVLEAFLLLAGRQELVVNRRLLEVRRLLSNFLASLDELNLGESDLIDEKVSLDRLPLGHDFSTSRDRPSSDTSGSP